MDFHPTRGRRYYAAHPEVKRYVPPRRAFPKFPRAKRPQVKELNQKGFDNLVAVHDAVMSAIPDAILGKRKLKENYESTVKCPICRGQIKFRVSAYNGHVAAQCQTRGCVSFLQ